MTQCANESNEQQLTLKMTDGYHLSYRYWRATKPTSTVVLLNGVMSHSQWFAPLAEVLNKSNVDVIGADRRESGINKQRCGDALSRQQLVSDVEQIINAHKVDQRPLYLLGWCWGAALAINAALESGDDLNGLALLAPGIYPSDTVHKRITQQQDRIRETELSLDEPCLDNPINEEMFTDSKWLDDYILKDKLRLRTITPRFFGIMLKMSANASLRLAEINCPILLITANNDKAIDNEKTIEKFEQLDSNFISMESCEAQHGMQFEVPDLLATLLCNWMQRLETGKV